MKPGSTTCPWQSTASAAGYCAFSSAASPTATIFSPSVTTEPFHKTRFAGPSVTTIPFSNRIVMRCFLSVLVAVTGRLVLPQRRELFGGARAHLQGADEALLGTDRAADAARWIGMRLAHGVQLDGEIGAARAVAAGHTGIQVGFSDLLDRREGHEVGDRM